MPRVVRRLVLVETEYADGECTLDVQVERATPQDVLRMLGRGVQSVRKKLSEMPLTRAGDALVERIPELGTLPSSILVG